MQITQRFSTKGLQSSVLKFESSPCCHWLITLFTQVCNILLYDYTSKYLSFNQWSISAFFKGSLLFKKL